MASVLSTLTPELANARLTELVKEIKDRLKEAETLSKVHNLHFSIFTDKMPASLTYDGEFDEYDSAGWQSSSYDC